MFCIQLVYKKTSILEFQTQPIKKEKQSYLLTKWISFEIFYSQLFNLSSHLLLFQYTSTGKNVHTTINNIKHPQYNHTISHNIPSQIKFNLNIMAFLGETTRQIIANSRLAFIFSNGSITHNQNSVYFQSLTPTPMRVPNDFLLRHSRVECTTPFSLPMIN